MNGRQWQGRRARELEGLRGIAPWEGGGGGGGGQREGGGGMRARRRGGGRGREPFKAMGPMLCKNVHSYFFVQIFFISFPLPLIFFFIFIIELTGISHV